jgi:hypothetical protein
MTKLEPTKILEKTDETTAVTKRPNENGQILVDGVIKIFDPDTQEVFVEVRT